MSEKIAALSNSLIPSRDKKIIPDGRSKLTYILNVDDCLPVIVIIVGVNNMDLMLKDKF